MAGCDEVSSCAAFRQDGSAAWPKHQLLRLQVAALFRLGRVSVGGGDRFAGGKPGNIFFRSPVVLSPNLLPGRRGSPPPLSVAGAPLVAHVALKLAGNLQHDDIAVHSVY